MLGARTVDSAEPMWVRGAGSGLETVEIGRQAIYDASLNSRAYQLFYRNSSRTALGADAERATCSVVLSAFGELGLGRIANNKRVFLPVGHDVVSGVLPLPISCDAAVLQVRDYEHAPRELISALRARKAEGYQIALDGFEYAPERAGLLELADYVKLNLRRLGPIGLREQLIVIRQRAGARLATVATRVETAEEFSSCIAAGCRYFQGQFLFRPQVLSHKRLPKSLKTITELSRRLRDPSVEFSEIERIVKTDPALGVSVLRFLGSAAYGLCRPVTSVTHAVTLLGTKEFAKWVTVVALTSTTERPSELALTALIRARACEIVASAHGADTESAFTVGLVSGLDALYEQPLARVLDELPLADSIRAAALSHEGALGKILAEVLGREDDGAPASSRFETGTVNRAWLEALSWANDAMGALG